MILILSDKFRKHIALLLAGIFYMQLIMAQHAGGNVVYPGYPTAERQVYAGNTTAGLERMLSPDRLSGLPAAGYYADHHTKTGLNDDHRSATAISRTHKEDASIGGPTQPEMQSFQSVNSNNMVDLFTGDFSYNIPLLDVGGYPVNIAYHSGISMDQEASWVGLGWNINPGSITRNMRGLPDDFNGGADTIRKVASIKPNNSWGVNVGADFELKGFPLHLSPSMGIFHNTYNGWGVENSLNVSINAGSKAQGYMSGGLTITDNSQNGITINPSLSFQSKKHEATNNGGIVYGLQFSAPYNSRTGLKDLQIGYSMSQNKTKEMQDKQSRTIDAESGIGSSISFASTAYTPAITMPYTNYNFSFTAKLGGEITVAHPNLFISGYLGKEYVAAPDTSLSLPAYGYLNFQQRANNWGALTDFNREKEIPYRDKPAVPHIAVPSYTYDVFSVSGEGTGGMFRPYRGDVGFIADHLIKSKTYSGALSVDLGAGNLAHGGVDLNANYSVTTFGPWLQENTLKSSIAFQNSNGLFEGSYFRNPGEKAINTTAFYKALGGDDVVAASLYQPGNSSPSILATNILTRYIEKQEVGKDTLNADSARRNNRDKRSQVISYLTASEASKSGLSKFIEHYTLNEFAPRYCENNAPGDAEGKGTGLQGYYFNNTELRGTPVKMRLDSFVFFNWDKGSPFWNGKGSIVHTDKNFPSDDFSVRWLGRLKAPVSGPFAFGIYTDDGIRMWINDSLVINDWHIHGWTWDTCRVNLVEGTLYNIRIEYFEHGGYSQCQWGWRRPDQSDHQFDPDHKDTVPKEVLYPPVFTDTAVINPLLTREDRVNNFRKANHISEIDVLNPDGRRYVYGIPVYNFVQKEVSFAVNAGEGNRQTGLTGYTNQENSTGNQSGKDGYFSKEEIPAYAHSFLLTGILSPDYVDITGDGISDDDIGDAVKFNYSKTSGIANPYGWRVPYIKDSANYSEGFRSYTRDDKGHYIYGTKELWYLHTIESKTMIATFTLEHRKDLLGTDERGNKTDGSKAMCLKQIDLYSKADFLENPGSAIPIKTVHFEYSYELCRGVHQPASDSGKLTLKKIWFTYNGNDKGVRNPYVFNYHGNNPGYAVNASDKWGTYKDPAQNPGATVGSPITNAEYPYALQDSALAAYNAAAWTLDSIQLPSGGRIKVNYESDDYAFVQNRRAAQMCKLAGFGTDTSGAYDNRLYTRSEDKLYAYIKLPYTVANNAELYARYLDTLKKFYFRLYIKMPGSGSESGSEYIPAYASADKSAAHWFGRPAADPGTMWIKLKGVNDAGDGDGPKSPLVQTAANFLRLNLPSKAYPGSEVNDDLGIAAGVKMLVSMAANVVELLNGYSKTVRNNWWVNEIDTARSFIRLNCPTLKKYGGGLRVKSILIYDNWNAMTNKKESVYGQAYTYTTTQSINGVSATISSGVASWEPSIGGEENPFHLPIEYTDQLSLLAPAATLYSEEPLGESFYPGASIGYSKVRVRSIHTDKTRSANGYAETTFFTSYDFPTTWDWSLLDGNTKKRYKPILGQLLRINAQNYLTVSQGFKVELNDMNGKLRTEATYAETDPNNPITRTENFYKVDNLSVQVKHLNNIVTTIDPAGNIDTAATIGKDIELMTDMRDQTSKSIGGNVNLDIDFFAAGVWPVAIPSVLGLFQQETNQFRSVAMTKIIQRYGILDSVVHMDKGSKIHSKNLLYDSETGDPLLVRTQNEFNDSIYQFTYPSHWAYQGAGPAYQNINAQLSHLTIVKGRITGGLSQPDSDYLIAGDELLVYSKQTIGDDCNGITATFPDAYRLWVIDTALLRGGSPSLFLVDQYGAPFSGNDVALKVTRSGRRNLNNSIGSVVSLANPLKADGSGNYHLVFDADSRVVNSSASELRQYWKVADKKRSDIITACVSNSNDSADAASGGCSCLKPFFDHLISTKQLFIKRVQHKTVGSLAAEAGISLSGCPILNNNADQFFYALSADSISSIYMARLGAEVISFRSVSGLPMHIYQMVSQSCDASGRVHYTNPGIAMPAPDTVSRIFYPDFTANLLSTQSCPIYLDSLMTVDSTSDHLLVENNLDIAGLKRNAVSVLRFDKLKSIPIGADLISAKLILQADLRGHAAPEWPNANSLNPVDSVGYALASPAGWFPYLPIDTTINQSYYSNWFMAVKNSTAFQNDTLDVKDYLSGYLIGAYASNTFVITQGSGPMHTDSLPDSASKQTVPPYLLGGYANYYATFYSTRYTDQSKWPAIQVQYVTQPFADTMGAILSYNATISCNTTIGRSCYSSITDTIVNPYQYGLLGNFRPEKSYVYYGSRAEVDPTQSTNIRSNGTISNFAPFWTLQSGHWVPAYDTTRWVWNSSTTLFNRKGFELEEKNPLGIYKSGIYGYGLTLPTAVIQNSRYQESAFEGFEDYGYVPNSCDTMCAEARPFDFSNYQSSISDSLAHTGLYSLRIGKDSSIIIGVPVLAGPDASDPQLTDSNSVICAQNRLAGVKASKNNVLPPFAPFAGKKMLLGAWVKERNVCTCLSYSRNHIQVHFTGGSSSTLTLNPSGNMIEGWQRYEAMVDIPADASGMELILQASDSSTTYFDDIRLHPYNAEMKSYIYNPVNLRLMAEMDENNYASFYEYDDDGTLIRVKKETQRGIQTIKETRSALIKN